MRPSSARRNEAKIIGADVYRYAGPTASPGSLSHLAGVVVRIRAEAGSETVEGYGEAVAPPSLVSSVWRRVNSVASALLGGDIPPVLQQRRPLQLVGGWRPVRLADRTATRAAKLAVETALLDLLMKWFDATPPDLWDGGNSAASVVSASHIVRLSALRQPATERDLITELSPTTSAQGALLLLRRTGDNELDLDWLERILSIEEKYGRSRCILLEGSDQSMEDAVGLVRRVSELVAALGRRAPLLIEESVVGEDSAVPHLQQVADALAGIAHDQERVVSLLAGRAVNSGVALRQLIDCGPVGAVRLSAERFGSLLGLRRAARLAKRLSPSTLVIVDSVRGSGISSSALRAIASTTPEVDWRLAEPMSGGWPFLAEPSDVSGAGLVGQVDLSELSLVVEEMVTLPEMSVASSAVPVNQYPGHPLPLARSEVRGSLLLATEAMRAGLHTTRFSTRHFLARDAASTSAVGFYAAESSLISAAASEAVKRKQVARAVLASRGLPIARGVYLCADRYDEASKVGQDIGFPLVVKPALGRKGRAVTTGIRSPEELDAAVERVAASRYADGGVVIEQFVQGSDYRILAAADEVFSVIKREPAAVIGDGRSAIEDLVVVANALRRRNPSLCQLPIRLDDRAERLLARQGHARKSIPEDGQLVLLSDVANLSQGGSSHEVLETTHASVLQLARAAVGAFPGLPYAGIDVILSDHTLPVEAQAVAIIELNSNPMLAMHHFPMRGTPRNAAVRLLRQLQAADNDGSGAADELTVSLSVWGCVQCSRYAAWLRRIADLLEVRADIQDPAESGCVAFVVSGASMRVGLLSLLAYKGPRGCHVTEARTEPVVQSHN